MSDSGVPAIAVPWSYQMTFGPQAEEHKCSTCSKITKIGSLYDDLFVCDACVKIDPAFVTSTKYDGPARPCITCACPTVAGILMPVAQAGPVLFCPTCILTGTCRNYLDNMGSPVTPAAAVTPTPMIPASIIPAPVTPTPATPAPAPAATTTPSTSRRIKASVGDLGIVRQCSACDKKSQLGAYYEDAPPVFFCDACVKLGKPKELYRDALNGEEKQGVIMTTCTACLKVKPVKLGIETGDARLSFCKACVDARKAHVGQAPRCAVCLNQADPRYTHEVRFIKLPHQPTFRKTVCSARCYAAITKFAEKSQPKGALRTFCQTCNIDVTQHPLRCSKCKSAFYCSRACQKSDWRNHRSLCQEVDDVPIIPVRTGTEVLDASFASGVSISGDASTVDR